jgi:hypothetical protein
VKTTAAFPCRGLRHAREGPDGFDFTASRRGQLSFSLESAPSNGQITQFDPVSGSVTYSPNGAFEGIDQFNFSVSAWGQKSDSQLVRIYVTPGPTLATNCQPRSILLTWDMTAVDQLFGSGFANAGFKVYRSTVSGGSYQSLTPTPLSPATRNYTDTSIVPGTSYYYVVTFLHQVFNCDGSQPTYESPPSNEVGPISTCCPPSTAPFWTDYGGTPQELAEWIMGPNVTVSNAKFNDTCSPDARGIFGGGNNVGLGGHVFPMDHGVILASGDIKGAVGPNDKSFGTWPEGGFQLPDGDPDLDNLAGGLGTGDAAVLTFDFISANSFQWQVQYIYASEEYPEYVGRQFADPMAIFITTDGNNTPQSNIAVIPQTPTPVNVNTVNGGCVSDVHGQNYPAVNPGYYQDNHDPTYSAQPAYAAPSPVYNLQYDGFAEDVTNSAPLTAEAAISANVTYHVKIAIADTPAGDYILDSAVFIKTQSFPCP